jgi:hypothetical protein
MSDTLQIQFQLFDLAPRPGILLLQVHPQGLCQLRLSVNSAPPVEIKLQKSPPFSIHEIYPAEFLKLINQLDITVSGPGSVVLSDAAFCTRSRLPARPKWIQRCERFGLRLRSRMGRGSRICGCLAAR